MIKNKKLWEKFEAGLQRKTLLNIDKNFQIFNELLKMAKEIGSFPPKDPLEGIEVDIRIAKILNYHELKYS